MKNRSLPSMNSYFTRVDVILRVPWRPETPSLLSLESSRSRTSLHDRIFETSLYRTPTYKLHYIRKKKIKKRKKKILPHGYCHSHKGNHCHSVFIPPSSLSSSFLLPHDRKKVSITLLSQQLPSDKAKCLSNGCVNVKGGLGSQQTASESRVGVSV